MTIRLRKHAETLDSEQLAALLTPTLLNPVRDDAPEAHPKSRPGTAWLRWGNGSRKATDPSLD